MTPKLQEIIIFNLRAIVLPGLVFKVKKFKMSTAVYKVKRNQVVLALFYTDSMWVCFSAEVLLRLLCLYVVY